MHATEILMEEHEAILRFIDALELAAEHLAAGQPVRAGFFLDAADFIKGFADGCHHHKEEGLLFPALHGLILVFELVELQLEQIRKILRV